MHKPGFYHHSEEVKKKISTKLKGNQNGKGYHHTSEAKEKISQARTGVPMSEETKAKIGARVITSKTRANISASRKGKIMCSDVEGNCHLFYPDEIPDNYYPIRGARRGAPAIRFWRAFESDGDNIVRFSNSKHRFSNTKR